MKGLELARSYWEAFGREMLDRDFPDLKEKLHLSVFYQFLQYLILLSCLQMIF